MVNKKKRQSSPHEGTDTSSESGVENSPNSNRHPKCNHIKTAVDLNGLKKAFKLPTFDAENCRDCIKANLQTENSEFEYDRTLWLCLKCGAHNCGRSVNKHALNHFEVSFIRS